MTIAKEPQTRIFSALLSVLMFAACSTSSDDLGSKEELKKQMREAYTLTSELYTYAWTPEEFFAPRSEKRIAFLLDALIRDFHTVSEVSSTQQNEPGFRIALDTQRSVLSDIKERFQSGNKEYANWQLRGLAQNCVACHSRWGDSSSFFADVRFLHGHSADEQLARAEYLIATRQFETASQELYSVARKFAKISSGTSFSLEAVKLLLVVELRVRDRPVFAEKQLRQLLSEANEFTEEEKDLLKSWISDLHTSAQQIQLIDTDELEASQMLLQPVRDKVRIADLEQNLVKTLIATRRLHLFLEENADFDSRRRKAMLLLSTAYARLPILSLGVYAPLYLEQCIREAPGTAEARRAYALYKERLQYEAAGSSGSNLDDEDFEILRELWALANQ